MAKKGANIENNFGVLGVGLGIVALFFSLVQPLMGGLMGVVGLIISSKQKKVNPNSWSKAGIILNIISIILAIALMILLFTFLRELTNDPALLAQLQGGV